MKNFIFIVLILALTSCGAGPNQALEKCADNTFAERSFSGSEGLEFLKKESLNSKFERLGYDESFEDCELRYQRSPETFMMKWGG